MKLYLQNIIEDISFENLPVKWQEFEAETKIDNKDLDYKFIKPLIWR